MKKITIRLFILSITIGIIFSTNSCTKEIDNSSSDIIALKTAVADLQKRSDSLALALKNTNNNVSTLSKSVDSIRIQLVQITNQIAQLNAQLAQNNSNINSINLQIADLNKQYLELLAILNNLIKDFTNTTVFLNSRIDSLSNSIKNLQKRSDSLGASLSSTNSVLLNYTKTVDTIKIQLAFIVTQINQLSTQMTQVNANIPLINSQITLLNQQYADLQTRLNEILNQLNNIPTTISVGLIGWYPFTGNANDSSDNRNNGVVNGAVLTTDRFGNTNSAYNFNNSYILIPNSTAYAVNNYSISIWLSSSSTSRQAAIMKLTYSNAANEQFGIVLNDLNINGVNVAAKYNNPSCSSGVGWQRNEKVQNILDGKFHHIIQIVNNENIYLYIDGSLVKTLNTGFSKSSSCFNGDIQIGRNWSNFNDYFNGKIDDVRIYNRALNDKEILYLSTH